MASKTLLRLTAILWVEMVGFTRLMRTDEVASIAILMRDLGLPDER